MSVMVRLRSLLFSQDIACSFVLHLVPWRGLEPPHPYGYTPLKRARLPIPPPRHGVQQNMR
jgi:hypothetical protein